MDKMGKQITEWPITPEPISYPDFEAMWSRIEQDKLEVASPTRLPRKRRAMVVLATAIVVLTATPVLAAVSNQWDLPFRPGVERALTKGYGQTIEQSAQDQGLTLSLHHAIADDNRTILLFSLETGEEQAGMWGIPDLQLIDQAGNVIEGHHSLTWDEELRRYNGYFETSWTLSGKKGQVQLVATSINKLTTKAIPIAVRPFSEEGQQFDIQEDGIDKLELRSANSGKEEIKLFTSIWLDEDATDSVEFPRVVVKQGEQVIRPSRTGAYGKPSEQSEWTATETYKQADVLKSDSQYELQYTQTEKQYSGNWTISPIELDKQKMLSGTFKRKLDIPFETSLGTNTIKKLIVSPTQVRVEVDSPSYEISFKEVELLVGSHRLKGGIWESDRDRTVYRFERPIDVEITEQDPLSLEWTYETTMHKDYKSPIHLANISEQPQHLMTTIGGYEVNWTYYMQDGDLYMESESEDPHFGGVNQTYVMQKNDRIPSRPLTVNFTGDGDNKLVEVQRGFKGNEADVYLYHYYVDHPDRQLNVNLQ